MKYTKKEALDDMYDKLDDPEGGADKDDTKDDDNKEHPQKQKKNEKKHFVNRRFRGIMRR